MSIETVAYGKVTWTNIERPTPEDIEVLRRSYNFHPLDLEDCLSKIERPKIDEYGDCLFTVMHFPVYDPDETAGGLMTSDFLVLQHRMTTTEPWPPYAARVSRRRQPATSSSLIGRAACAA